VDNGQEMELGLFHRERDEEKGTGMGNLKGVSEISDWV